ncbi:MAG: sugar ABC transporter substrate-binding protein [Oscillospiraceae bacterium]|jgi:ABC-type sugar transport system substrate-binding protein
MKKLTAIALGILIILSLAAFTGCKKSEPGKPSAPEKPAATEAPAADKGGSEAEAPATEPEIDLKNTKPGEYIKEKLAAGMQVDVAFCALNDNFFVKQQLSDPLKQVLEAEGFTYTHYVAQDGNVLEQINQLENLVEMGVACIVIQCGDPTNLQDQVKAAQDAGTIVVIYGIEVPYDVIMTMTNVGEVGRQMAAMGSGWIDQYYPDAGEGDIHTAVFGAQNIPPVVELCNGIIEGVDADPRMLRSITNLNDLTEPEECYNATQDALMVDPDLQLFICFQMSGCLGINNYLMAQAGLDPWKYAIFGSSDDDTTQQLLDDAAAGKGCFRGTIQAGEYPAATLQKVTLKALYGEIKTPYKEYDPMRAWVSSDMNYHYSTFEE